MKMRNEIKAVLFDIDDTLFDRKKAVKMVLRQMIGKLPDLFSSVPEEKVMEAFREADRMALKIFNKGASGEVARAQRSRRFLRTLGLPEEFSDKITIMYIGAYPALSVSVKDAKRVVEKLAKIFPLGIISNAFPDIQYHKIEGLGIRHLFQLILLSEEIGIRKPDKAIFQEAANRLGKQPDDCLFVGDSYDTDIIGAKRSGMKACWFNRDDNPVQDEEIKPDFEITSLSELLNILDIPE